MRNQRVPRSSGSEGGGSEGGDSNARRGDGGDSHSERRGGGGAGETSDALVGSRPAASTSSSATGLGPLPPARFYSRSRTTVAEQSAATDGTAGTVPEPAAKRRKNVSAALEVLADDDLGVIGPLPDDDGVGELDGGGEIDGFSGCDETVGYKPTPLLPRSRSFLAEVPQKPPALTIMSCAYSEVYDTPQSPTCDPHKSGDDGHFVIRKPCRPSSQEGFFSTLADELVLAVFRFLPQHSLARCARVCRRWYRLALDKDLWQRVNLSGRHLSCSVLWAILSRGVLYLSLARSDISMPCLPSDPVPLWSGGLRWQMEDGCCRLLYLDLSMSTISVDGLVELLSHCRTLRKLSLEGCTVCDESCRSIGKNTSLNTLNLSQCEGVTEVGLSAICEGCPQLTSLNVAWTQLSKEAISVLIRCLPSGLTQLNLSGCRDQLTDEDVLQLVSTCPNLTELDLSDNGQLGAASIGHLVRYLRGLQQLSMSRCYRIDQNLLTALQDVATLKSFNMHGTFPPHVLLQVQQSLSGVAINSALFSSIARPTVGGSRTSIWNERVRELRW